MHNKTNMAAPGVMHVDDLPAELRKLLQTYPNLEFDGVREKIKCRYSGHEMPCSVATVQAYLNGKQFKKSQQKCGFDYEKLKPHIVPNTKRRRENQLFCTLTMRHLNRLPSHVQRHIAGRRYKRALARWEECQKTGETFRPNRGRSKQDEGGNFSPQTQDKESGEEEESDVDSLSDLYPGEDFAGSVDEAMEMESGGKTSSVSEEDMDVTGQTGLPDKPENRPAKGKRKQEVSSGKQNFKKHKSKGSRGK